MPKVKPVRAKDVMAARTIRPTKCPFCKGKTFISKLIEIAKTINGYKWFSMTCQRCNRKGVIYGENSDKALQNLGNRSVMQLIWTNLKHDTPMKNASYLWKFKDGIMREGTLKAAGRITTVDGDKNIADVNSFAQIPQGY